METEGIEGLLIETHNWGKTVAFWKGLGYDPDGREVGVQAPLANEKGHHD